MSQTTVFTPLKPLNENDISVRIIDYDKFKSHMEEYKHVSLEALKSEKLEKENDSYPKQYAEYIYLKGFTAYPNKAPKHVDKHTVLKLENFGYEYSQDLFIEFWEEVATFCEPFSFLHSPANHFPRSTEMFEDTWPNYIYRVKGKDGEIEVEKHQLW